MQYVQHVDVTKPIDPIKPLLVALENFDAPLGWTVKARLDRGSHFLLERAMHNADRLEREFAELLRSTIPFLEENFALFRVHLVAAASENLGKGLKDGTLLGALRARSISITTEPEVKG